ncbi:MAG: regulatory protein MarR [Acidimicrobiaceae bacterium]|nr:regulatory protein MarR [Acidimicrobiaceae bacterium]
MTETLEVDEIAAALLMSINLLRRRVRQTDAPRDLTAPELSALARLDHYGPSTSAELARAEHISPQSMGATLAGLEARGVVERNPDPLDGRRVVMSISEHGREALRDIRSARAQQLAKALSSGFTTAELRQLAEVAPLIERLAHSV